MAAGYDLTGVTNPRIGLLAAANQTAGAGITATFDWFTLGEDATCEPGGGPADTDGTDDDAHHPGGHRLGRLVHHASVVHPGGHRRSGRVGRCLDRVPHRRRRLDALHRCGLRDR